MVDLGMTFGDPDYPGIDLVLPDLAFIEERRETCSASCSPTGTRIISARSPISRSISACRSTRPPFTAGLIREKLEEEGLADRVKLKIVKIGEPLAARAVRGRLGAAGALDPRDATRC